MNQFVIDAERSDELRRYLGIGGLERDLLSDSAALQTCFGYLGCGEGRSVSELLAKETLVTSCISVAGRMWKVVESEQISSVG